MNREHRVFNPEMECMSRDERLHLQGEGQLTLRSLAKTRSTATGKILEEEEM